MRLPEPGPLSVGAYTAASPAGPRRRRRKDIGTLPGIPGETETQSAVGRSRTEP